MTCRLLLTLILFLFSLPCLIIAGPASDTEGATIFQNVCAACHGPKGEGKDEVKAPSIAALPTWYSKLQITNFREGRRGNDPAHDPQGSIMAAIAKTLTDPQIEAVTKHVESLPLVVPAKLQIEGANFQEGQRLFYERCMECHRYNASGEMTFGSPPLVGRQGWYLVDQLLKFKSLRRGTIKGDQNGAKMVQMVNFLDNEQAIKDVVTFILSLNPPADKNDIFKAPRPQP